jgi:hypothetical protein
VALFFCHVQEYHHLYKALVRSGQIELLYKKGHERLRHNIEQHMGQLIPAGGDAGPPLSLVADYVANTLVGMLRWWLNNEMTYSPDQMEGLFHQLVLPVVEARDNRNVIALQRRVCILVKEG